MPTPIQEPKFIKNITWLQGVFASVAVSMFFCVYAMGWGVVINIFKPDFIGLLTKLRVSIMVIGIILTSFVGYHQIKNMAGWVVENYELYKKLKEAQKEDKEK